MNYDELYNEFANKWRFTKDLNVFDYAFVQSNGKYKLYLIKSDRRSITGRKFDLVYSTYNANEMRDYLTKNEPQKGYIVTTKGGYYVGLFNYGRSYQVAFTKRVLKCTREVAEKLAQDFGGEVIEVAI